MESSLTIEWDTDLPRPAAQLHRYEKHSPQETISGEMTARKVVFPILASGSYLLDFTYELSGKRFDSCYFLFDSPDITHIYLNVHSLGCQFDKLGFFDTQGEFVDMLLYEGDKPFFTFPCPKDSLHARLVHFLIFEFSERDPLQKKQVMRTLMPDLGQAYPVLEQLWPYQLRKFIHPTLLGKTSPEWKACLLQLVRNNLILMENERLMAILQDAIEFAQEGDRVEFLLALMEWDPDKQDWIDFPLFMEEISGRGILKST